MALNDLVYSDGTITVTQNQKAFTGTGTAWQLKNAVGAIVIINGMMNIVESLSAENAGQLKRAWVGPSAANVAYDMWLVPAEANTSLAQHAKIVEILTGIKAAQPGNKNLTGLASLISAANKLGYFVDDKGNMSLTDFTAAGRSLVAGTNAAAQMTTLGFSPFVQSLVDDVNATTFRTSIGAFSTSGGTITGAVTLDTNLSSSTVNLVLGPTGAGAVYLRPNGVNSASGQAIIGSDGTFTALKQMTNSVFASVSQFALVAANGAGAGKGVYLRPNGDASDSGQVVVGTTGDVSITQNVQAKSGFLVLGASGNSINLRPNGTGSTSGEAYISAVGALVISASAYKPGGGAWSDSSDIRFKDVRREYGSGLAEILKLTPKVYNFRKETGRDAGVEYIGLIAQEAEAAFPEMFHIHKQKLGELEFDDARTYDSSALIYALVNAVKELSKKNDALVQRLAVAGI